METTTAANRLRGLLAEGKPLDEALATLRTEGASIVVSILALHKCRDCSLVEAKKTVVLSAAWADRREMHEEFHRKLEEELNNG